MATAATKRRTANHSSPQATPGASTSGLRLLEVSYGHGRVDAPAAIIYGAKIVGLESRNVGRTIGLDPREFGAALDKPYGYARRALESAIPMYEGSEVRIDHPPTAMKEGVRVVLSSSRGVMETVGVLQAVHFEKDGLYGDIHLYKSHPSTALILERAEKTPNKIALSHNAHGIPVMEGGRAVIDQITEVYSVDIVGDKPGTTNGLFESFESQAILDHQEQGAATVKQTIKQIIESLAAGETTKEFRGKNGAANPANKPIVSLLEEMGGEYPAMMATEVESAEGAKPEDAIGNALSAAGHAILDDNSLDDAAKLAKLKQLFKIKNQVEGAESAANKGEGAPVKESLTPSTVTDPAVKQLMEDVAAFKAEANELKAEKHARSLLETAQREPTDVRIAAVVRASDDAARKALIETWPKQADPLDAVRPVRSAPLMESAADGQAEDSKSFVRRLQVRC